MNGERKDHESVMYAACPATVGKPSHRLYVRELDISYWPIDETRITEVAGMAPALKHGRDGQPLTMTALPVNAVEAATLQRILDARAALEVAEKDASVIFNKAFQEKST